jgi:hypothetical protein
MKKKVNMLLKHLMLMGEMIEKRVDVMARILLRLERLHVLLQILTLLENSVVGIQAINMQ